MERAAVYTETGESKISFKKSSLYASARNWSGTSPGDVRGKNILEYGKSTCQGPEWECAWWVWGTRERPAGLRQSW